LNTTSTPDFNGVQIRVARPTNNLEAIIEFYTAGLGLIILSRFEDHNGYNGVMLGQTGEQYHLEFTYGKNQPDIKPPTKDNLLVFYFPDDRLLTLIKRRIEKLGYKLVSPENPYWNDKSFTFEDPDGWRVILYNGSFNPSGNY
jgi:catechol 2,3-dioxygenase-like lactoylglutathione lyase family enzyme